MLNDQPKLHGLVWPLVLVLMFFSTQYFYVFPAKSGAQKASSPFLDGQSTTLSLALLPLSLLRPDWMSELFLWSW